MGEVDKLLVILGDQYLRNEFYDLVNEFCTYLDRVLPRPEALDYENDAREFVTAQYRTRRLFRDTRSGGLDPYSYGAKVRRLIDEHLRAIGIAQRIPPVEITAADFRERVAALDSSQIRGMEMEHALRRHLTDHQASDPVYYEQLSDRIDRLLEQLRGDSEGLAAALDELINEVRERETSTEGSGLDPRTERPIRSILERAYAESTTEHLDRVPVVPVDRFDELSRQVAIEIRLEVSPPHFITSVVLQERLRRKVYSLLNDTDMYTREGASRAAQDILALARANRDFYLLRGGA
jgi:type I restriction enzyme R subunit